MTSCVVQLDPVHDERSSKLIQLLEADLVEFEAPISDNALH